MRISPQQLYVVGGRLMGIYFLSIAVVSVPSAIGGYLWTLQESRITQQSFWMMAFLTPLTWAVAGGLTLRYFSKYPVSVQSEDWLITQSLPTTAIELMGFYWFADSAVGAIRVAVSSIGIDGALFLRSGDLISYIAGIPIGWAVIRYASRIADRLSRIK